MDRRGTLITAVVLIAIGGYLLLANLGIIPPYPIEQMWPGIVVLVGILFWLGFIFGKDHDPGLAFVGTIVTLTGLFFFLFTFNVNLLGLGRVDWSDMALLWPAFPLIVGIAFVVMWAAGRFRDWGLLIPAGILLLVGIGGFAFTLGNVPVFQNILQWWPLLLIFFGIVVLIQSIRRSRAK
jgi:hypothetical protein